MNTVPMKLPHPTRLNGLRYVVAAVLALAAAVCVFAEDGSLKWEMNSQSFSAEFGQEKVVAVYPFTNTGESPVTISNATASCGCTVPSLDKKVYQPGETGELTAIFTVGSRQGHQTKTIEVQTEEGTKLPNYHLKLEVDIPVPVVLKPRVRFWRVGSEASTQEVTVTIDSAVPMTISGLVTQTKEEASENFDYKIETVEAGHEYIVRITPKTSETKSREVFYLTSPDDEKSILKSFPIYAYVR